MLPFIITYFSSFLLPNITNLKCSTIFMICFFLVLEFGCWDEAGCGIGEAGPYAGGPDESLFSSNHGGFSPSNLGGMMW